MTLKSNFKFYLTDKFNSGSTTVTIGNDVETNSSVELTTATSILIRHPDKADVIERVTGTATGGTLTTTARGLSNANPGVADSSREVDRRPGAICYVTLFPEDIIEKDASDTASGDLTFSGDITFSGSSKMPVYADATARDAAITSPANGMLVYNTATGKMEQYIAGAWADVDSGGTFSNASATVAGKVEIATDAEILAETDTGGTGAQLVATPSQLSPDKLTDKTSVVDADKIRIADSADSDAAKHIQVSYLREGIAGSKTAKGTWEMLTDAEAITATDETRVPNIKQINDVYAKLYTVVTSTEVLISSTDAQTSTASTSYVKVRDTAVTYAGTYNVSFDLSDTGVGTATGRIYVDEVAVGTERSGPGTYAEDITVTAGANIQIYAKNSSGGANTTEIDNFRIYGALVPVTRATVVL